MIVLFFYLLQSARCQPALDPLSARYTGIGTYSRHFTDAFSGTSNQAVLARISQAAAGVYGERRFLLKELSHYAAAIAWPVKTGGMGIALQYFGSENFNTSQIGLGYGRTLGDKIDIGIQFNYYSIRLSGYGSSAVVNAEAGALLQLTDHLYMGIHVYNPAGSRFGNRKGEKLASVYTSGVGYEASDKVFIGAEISKQQDQPVNINAGLQYMFADRLFARLGLAPATGNYFFGWGLQWKNFRVDAISSWQSPLGFSPAILLLFNLHETSPQPPAEK